MMNIHPWAPFNILHQEQHPSNISLPRHLEQQLAHMDPRLHAQTQRIPHIMVLILLSRTRIPQRRRDDLV